jgi:hypothetical protein
VTRGDEEGEHDAVTRTKRGGGDSLDSDAHADSAETDHG